MHSKRRVITLSVLAFLLLFAIIFVLLFVLGVFSVSMGAPVLTYKGESVTTVELSYWMSTMKTQYLSSQGETGNEYPAFWEQNVTQTQTHKQRFDELLRVKLNQILVSKYLFRAWGLSYPAGTDVDAMIEERKESYRRYQEMDVWKEDLERLGVNERQLRQIYLAEQKVLAVKNHIIATFCEDTALYAASMQNYFADHYLCVQYGVVYLNYDVQSGKDLTDFNDIEQKRIQANTFYQKALTEEKTAVELIRQYSDYDSLTGYTNGWFLSQQDSFDSLLYEKFAQTEIGAWGRFDFTEDGMEYAYIWRRNGISNYDLMNQSEKNTLAIRTQDTYYVSQINRFFGDIECQQSLYDSFSVVEAKPSRNTNL